MRSVYSLPPSIRLTPLREAVVRPSSLPLPLPLSDDDEDDEDDEDDADVDDEDCGVQEEFKNDGLAASGTALMTNPSSTAWSRKWGRVGCRKRAAGQGGEHAG